VAGMKKTPNDHAEPTKKISSFCHVVYILVPLPAKTRSISILIKYLTTVSKIIRLFSPSETNGPQLSPYIRLQKEQLLDNN